jgi:hypothetical protein
LCPPVLFQENQAAFGEVGELSIKDGDAKEGDIIVSNGSELSLSTNPYQNVMVGTVVDKPAATVKPGTLPANGGAGGAKKTVILSGVALVNVTTKGGDIRKGDWITSSDIKGVGMKALRSGYVLGSSMDDYSNKNHEEVKKIRVSINVHYLSTGTSIRTKIGDIIKLAALAAYENPKVALKYVTAIIVSLGAIIFTFFSFGRISRLGIIALGRNPLASKKIYKGILINAGSSLAIIVGGMVVAFLVLKFS